MARLLKLLLLATLVLPFITGLVAVAAGFGDPWGMGAKDPWGVFLSAALPILPPGFYQIVAWPLTFGVALLLVPLAGFRRGQGVVIVLLPYLAVASAAWSLGWVMAPDELNLWIDGKSFRPGHLNSNLRKLGILFLTDSVVVASAVLWWYRKHAEQAARA